MILGAFWAGILAAVIMAIWIGVAAKHNLVKAHQINLLGNLVLGRRSGVKRATLIGFVPHVLVGGLIGGVYGWLFETGGVFSGAPYTQVIILALATWLLMELLVMPLVGQGIFGVKGDLKRSLPTWLALHGIYSVFLVYFFFLFNS